MIVKSILNVKLYQLLFLIDQDLAELKRVKNCPYCGSSIHASNYLRKPRGGPDNLPETLSLRHSFCCSAEECRRRVLPASLRFWEKKVYWGLVILVTVTLKQGRAEGYSASKLKRLVGISRQTLKRWMLYFKRVFPVSDRYKRLKGHIGFEIDTGSIPSALVLFFIKRFESVEKGLLMSLQVLSGGAEMI